MKMQNSIFRKGMVAGIVVFLIGISIVPSTANVININSITKDEFTLISLKSGKTLYVGGSGPGNYTKIQDAIDDSTDGDTVFVYAYSSPYYENILVEKSITLIGEDKNNTVIEGDSNFHGVYVIKIKANYVNIIGFTIQSQGEYTPYPDDGIWILTPYNVIEGNIIQYTRIGIYLSSASRNIIKNNTIRNNKQDGIRTYGSGSNVIENNHFNDNNFEAIKVGYRASDYIIKDNILFEDYIEMPRNSFNHIVINNTVNGKKILYFEKESNINIHEDICGQIILNNCDNFYLENQKARITLLSSNNCKIFNNSISDVNIGIYLYYSDYNIINNCNSSIKIRGSNNNIINNTVIKGIRLSDSKNNKIEHNSINGMYFFQSNSNEIINNSILNMELDIGDSNIFMRNKIEGTFDLSFTAFNIISKNNFTNCNFNSYMPTSNIISKNNLYNVTVEFRQSIYRFYLNNKWSKNYWDDWNGNRPYLIFGHADVIIGYDEYGNPITKRIDLVNFDWNPAKEPYDINDEDKYVTGIQSLKEGPLTENINKNSKSSGQQNINQQTQTTQQQIIRSNFLNRLIRR